MKKSKKLVTKEELARDAYKLGFEVGYYKHYEAVGWVKKEKRRIEDLAKKLGVLDEIMKVYERGKEDGERKKSVGMLEEKETRASGRAPEPVKAIRALAHPAREPHFFHIPKFLKRNQK